jgi:hypothetical protein
MGACFLNGDTGDREDLPADDNEMFVFISFAVKSGVSAGRDVAESVLPDQE